MEFGFVSVIVNNESPLTATPVGENDLATVGGNSTVKGALAALRLVPPLDVSPPAAKVLLNVPAVADVTLTVTVQVLFAGMVAPEIASDGPEATAVTVPRGQVVAPPGAAVFVTPAGYVSVKAATVISTAFGFVRETVNNDVPF